MSNHHNSAMSGKGDQPSSAVISKRVSMSHGPGTSFESAKGKHFLEGYRVEPYFRWARATHNGVLPTTTLREDSTLVPASY
jgi:hypothetical protein